MTASVKMLVPLEDQLTNVMIQLAEEVDEFEDVTNKFEQRFEVLDNRIKELLALLD